MMSSYNTSTGNKSGNNYLYCYFISTNSSNLISAINFPSDTNIRILAIDEINAAQQKNPDDGVIEGALAVVKAGAAGSGAPHVGLRASFGSPSFSATFPPVGTGISGDDVVSMALSQVSSSYRQPEVADDFVVASGPLWAGQFASETGRSPGDGTLSDSAPLALRIARVKGRFGLS
jgi:hypothetical protein